MSGSNQSDDSESRNERRKQLRELNNMEEDNVSEDAKATPSKISSALETDDSAPIK